MKHVQTIRFVIATLLCVWGLKPAAAQETQSKPNVFIDYFWRPTEISFTVAEQLRNNVIEGINNTNRVSLIDVDSNDALAVEKSRREAGNLDAGDDAERLKVMSQQGANFLIQGRIGSIVTERHTTDQGSVYYDAVLTYTLKVINPNDGTLVASKTFKHGGEFLNLETSSTPEEAVMKVCKHTLKGVVPFVHEAFPVIGSILEANETKKDDIKSVYISVGDAAGVAKGAWFAICVEREIAGRKSQKEIGRLEVENVEGDDISLAKIKKGGKELKAAMDAGQTVIIKSIPKPQNAMGKLGGSFKI
ncbi:MAG: penicillin-binding protein activator LpoB [Muribaculaceae bacterium]|nr:penicillin-binding protein activator LpoB [Muribaculaceae bacterium]